MRASDSSRPMFGQLPIEESAIYDAWKALETYPQLFWKLASCAREHPSEWKHRICTTVEARCAARPRLLPTRRLAMQSPPRGSPWRHPLLLIPPCKPRRLRPNPLRLRSADL